MTVGDALLMNLSPPSPIFLMPRASFATTTEDRDSAFIDNKLQWRKCNSGCEFLFHIRSEAFCNAWVHLFRSCSSGRPCSWAVIHGCTSLPLPWVLVCFDRGLQGGVGRAGGLRCLAEYFLQLRKRAGEKHKIRAYFYT